MNGVTVVTGPMRSGTSCVTGLLELCGFSLGRQLRVFRNSTEYNPTGHFEIDLLFTINERLLKEVPGGYWSMLNIPHERAIAALAAERERYFHLFIRKFDGDLCKDPLMCLTLPFWKHHWPELKKVIFCIRHPLAVAQSMNNRYGISPHYGLELWKTYTTRFLSSAERHETFIFDFDAFTKDPVNVFSPLLVWLGRPMEKSIILKHIRTFYDSKHVHWNFTDDFECLPDYVKEQYIKVRSFARQQL